jgi:hypothetical protein
VDVLQMQVAVLGSDVLLFQRSSCGALLDERSLGGEKCALVARHVIACAQILL